MSTFHIQEASFSGPRTDAVLYWEPNTPKPESPDPIAYWYCCLIFSLYSPSAGSPEPEFGRFRV